MFILEQKYGNDGYAFWFKLLEMLGSTGGHCLHFVNDMDWEFLIAKTRLDKEKCTEILDLLATLGAIDKELWNEKIVWSDNFIENIKDAYRNRTVDIPSKPSILRKKSVSNGINDVINLHTKLKETKLKETKENIYSLVISYLNEKADRNYQVIKTNTDYIAARIKEGNYTLDDFKKVIDNKVARWKGDIKYSSYLRPETLFGKKFESYLNEENIKNTFRNPEPADYSERPYDDSDIEPGPAKTVIF
jgi:uncharacterized phage protein (TIGR02220 family)